MKSRSTKLRGATQLWPLMRDPRIPFWAKAAIPAVAAAYVLSPIDLIPDFLIGVGQLDDIGVMLLALSAVVALLQRFGAVREVQPEAAHASATKQEDTSTIYDATYRVK